MKLISTPDLANRKGFTLIEVLVVLGIMGAIIALGLGRVRKKDNDIKKVARGFYVLGKEIRNSARLKNSTFRLVIRLDEGAQSYWVEAATGFQGRIGEKDQEERPKEIFDKDTSVLKKEKILPDGLFFKSVENLDGEIQTTGLAMIYFFPNGFVETSALQITDRKKITWTLIYQPLTGQADIIPEERSLRDSKRE
jgi:general secretion pathway protein H